MYNSPEYQSLISVARSYVKEVADPQYDMKRPAGKQLGDAGDFGQAHMGYDKDSVLKKPLDDPNHKHNIGKHEMSSMEIMDGTPGFPRLLNKEVKKTKDGYQGNIAISLAKGKELSKVASDMPQDKRQDAFRQLIQMRKKMHQKGVAHNDMHAKNIFVDDDNKTSLIDFGEATVHPLAALGEALGYTSDDMAFDMPFDGAMSPGDGVDMRDPEMMKLLKNNHGKVMEQLESMKGGSEFQKFKMMPYGKHTGNRDFDEIQSETGELTNDKIYELINMYYEGIEEEKAPTKTRMQRAVGDLINVRNRVGRGGNVRKGENLVPDRNLDD